MLEIINVIVFVCVLMKSRWAASRNFRGRFLKIKSPHLQRRDVSAKSAEDGGRRTEDGGAPCRSTARTGPHSLFGGVSSPLLSSGPLPSLSSHPTSLPLSRPGAGEARVWFSERERGREGRERESFGKSHKAFSSERERRAESSGVIRRKAALLRTPQSARRVPDRRTEGEEERKRTKRGRKRRQMMMTSDLGDSWSLCSAWQLQLWISKRSRRDFSNSSSLLTTLRWWF